MVYVSGILQYITINAGELFVAEQRKALTNAKKNKYVLRRRVTKHI